MEGTEFSAEEKLSLLITQLQEASCVSVASLQQIVDAADCNSLPPGMILWEVDAAKQAVDAVTSYKCAASLARTRVDSRSMDVSILDVLEGLLATWQRLSAVEQESRASDKSPCIAARVQLVDQSRWGEAGALCEALIDRAVDAKAHLYKQVMESSSTDLATVLLFEDRLRKLCSNGWTFETLCGLGVTPPPEVLGTESVSAPDETPTNSLIVNSNGFSSPHETSSTQRNFEIAAQPSIPNAFTAPKNSKTVDSNLLNHVSAGTQAHKVEASATWEPIGTRKNVRFKDPPESGDLRAELAAVHGVPYSASASSPIRKPSGPPSNSTAGSTELWRAVHVGDEAALRHLVTSGVCTPAVRDGSNHSVLWHLIAWGHLALALLILDTFPVAAEGGVDPAELHHKRGDTLLHLLCQTKHFSAEAAELFKRLSAVAALGNLFLHRNAGGETFLDIASASLNFWVVRFVLWNYPVAAAALVSGPPPDLACVVDPPLRSLARRLAKPRPPTASALKRRPHPLDFLQMLTADAATGIVPCADVAFDVGPDNDAGARRLVLAHRAIIAARSPVLMEELKRRTLEPVPGFNGFRACMVRVDPRVSKDVWKCVMYFLYSGEVRPLASDDLCQLVQLVRACGLYRLPRPLLEHAQARLFTLLANASPSVLLEVFEITQEYFSDSKSFPMKESAAYWLLRCAHELCGKRTPPDISRILNSAVEAVEMAVFRRP